MKLSTFLLNWRSVFRSFVVFIASHYYFSGCNVFPYSVNFEFLRYFFHRYLLLGLALSISRLLLFIFSLVISYLTYFKFAMLKARVIFCNTLKKEGRAFRNIGKNMSLLLLIFVYYNFAYFLKGT